MNGKYGQPFLVCQLISTTNATWRFLFRQEFSTFCHLPVSQKIEYSMDWVYFGLLFTQINKSGSMQIWTVLILKSWAQTLRMIDKAQFPPKYKENSRQVLILNWVLLQCTHGLALWHANIHSQVPRTKAKKSLLDSPHALYSVLCDG